MRFRSPAPSAGAGRGAGAGVGADSGADESSLGARKTCAVASCVGSSRVPLAGMVRVSARASLSAKVGDRWYAGGVAAAAL